MYTTGLPLISLSFFSAASEAVVIPTGVQLFAFIATLLLGRVKFEVPMLFVMGFLFIFVLGGLTGVMVAIVPFDWQVHDSYFIVAHLHHTLIGGMLFPMFAALYYWMPVFSGRKLRPRLGQLAFWLMLIGFLVTFFTMHFTGLLGMPRRVYTYPEGLGWDGLNLTSTVGAFIFATGVLVFLIDVATHFRRGEKASRNPWNAGSLDWMMEIPPEAWGARCVPIIKSRYPLWEQKNFLEDVDNGRFLIPDAPDLHRETIVSTVTDARPVQVLRVPGPSWWPLLSAVFTGGFFIAATFHAWLVASLSAAAAFVAILCWVWDTAEIPKTNSRDAGCGYVLPLYISGHHSVGWWALFITLLGDSAVFVSLIFAYFFFWTVNPAWPPPGYQPFDLTLPAVAIAMLAATSLCIHWAVTTLNKGATGRFQFALWLGCALLIVFAILQLFWAFTTGLQPTAHAYPAIVWTLLLYQLLHVAVALVMGIYTLVRYWAGRLAPGYDIELRNAALFWHYTVIQGLIVMGVIDLFPRAS